MQFGHRSPPLRCWDGRINGQCFAILARDEDEDILVLAHPAALAKICLWIPLLDRVDGFDDGFLEELEPEGPPAKWCLVELALVLDEADALVRFGQVNAQLWVVEVIQEAPDALLDMRARDDLAALDFLGIEMQVGAVRRQQTRPLLVRLLTSRLTHTRRGHRRHLPASRRASWSAWRRS